MAIETLIEKRDDGYFRVKRHYSSHTGMVSIKIGDGAEVEEGDLLYTITRLGLIKKRLACITGTVRNINTSVDNVFCGYYTHVLDVEHMLNDEEVQILEEERDYIFVEAPQGAQYYTTSNPGMPPIVNVGDRVDSGSVLAVAMVMKKRREIIYQGPRGRVAKIYFMNGQQVKAGQKLFGILPKPVK